MIFFWSLFLLSTEEFIPPISHCTVVSSSQLDAMAMTLSPPLTLHEVELAAKAKLPQHIYEFYASGSDDEKALRRNIDAFNRYGNPPNHHQRSSIRIQSHVQLTRSL